MTRGHPRSPVVVTGCGTINALGPDAASFWERLVRGECGILPHAGLLGGGADLLAAAVADPLPPLPAGRPALSRTEHLALVAAMEAANQAKLHLWEDRDRIAVVIGTTTGGIREVEEAFLPRGTLAEAPRTSLLAFEKAQAADAVAHRLAASGPRLTLQTACASGASAIIVGAAMLLEGQADVVLAGGSDALARITLAGFRALRVLDTAPCRPFDRSRRGLSLGEGAAMLVLERADTAVCRGAPVLARLLGAAQSTDAYHLTAPLEDGSGAARALRAALGAAETSPDEVDHVNAHGTGTPQNDAAEAAALLAVLGDRAQRCPVTSIKGAIGHTLGAAGAIEAVAAIWTLRTGLIPPTAGLEDPDAALGLDVVHGRPRQGYWRVALTNSFGFGGANAVLCFGRGEA